eukprot:tig00000615_g2567.t1
MTEGSQSAAVRPRETRPTAIKPSTFFVAWQGVLSLAFEGFAPSVLALKQRIDAQGLNGTEAPGSKWPKVTLGCVSDGEALTLEELAALKRVCEEISLSDVPAVPLRELRLVRYACRSLERRLREWPVSLAGEEEAAAPPPEHRAYVQSVVAEFLRAEPAAYHPLVAREGNREGHYRGDFEGYTLVANLPAEHPVRTKMAEFRARADAACPRKLRWFAGRALHCTVRALTEEGARALVAELAPAPAPAAGPAPPASPGSGSFPAD